MATATERGPFARKPTEQLVRETGGDEGLRRAVGVLDLTALGIGAIIGTGIFVMYAVYGRAHSRLQRGLGADEGRADVVA